MPEKRKLLETWFQRVWNEEDANAVDEMFVDGGAARGLGDRDVVGPEQFKQFQTALCGLVSGITVTIDKAIKEEQWLSTICTLRATSRETGGPVSMSGSVVVKISDGKILEGYNHWDFMSLWDQLGYLPGDSFAKGLQGQKII
ncbi:MAG: ester cyclase [Kordiimonadaceae bacterium]|nr:ester cyclase [Kordiimonadaceae bacterium]